MPSQVHFTSTLSNDHHDDKDKIGKNANNKNKIGGWRIIHGGQMCDFKEDP